MAMARRLRHQSRGSSPSRCSTPTPTTRAARADASTIDDHQGPRLLHRGHAGQRRHRLHDDLSVGTAQRHERHARRRLRRQHRAGEVTRVSISVDSGSDERPGPGRGAARAGLPGVVRGPRRARAAHPPGSKGPDAFVFDIREMARLPARGRARCKRQFPTSGIVIVARALDPTDHARGDAHGRQRVGGRAAEPR